MPTRELAIQVAEAVHRYGRELGARVLAVYGGAPIARQISALRNGVDIVVATPGRAIDHISRGTADFGQLSTIVLDEADEMLDMGFAEDIEAIMAAVPQERQTVLFSATLPKRIDGLVRQYLRDPVRIQIAREQAGTENAKVRQVAYLVPRQHKANALGRLLDIESPTATVIFCRTRDEVDTLGETLAARGYRAEALHGGMTQDQRDRVMAKIRNQTSEVLVATDVAARGLDIDHLTHVVNYDLPSAADAYVHRIGRVGRAGREGTAITLVEPRQHRLLKSIEKVTKSRIAVETLPTVADLRARRLDMTRAALAQTLQDAEFEQYRVVVDTLTDDYDLVEIAMAAVQLAHESMVGGPDEDIPDSRPFEAPREPADRPDGPSRPSKPRSNDGGPTTRIFVSLGHAAKVRPPGSRRRHRERVQPVGPPDRGHRDHPQVLDRRGAHPGRGRGDRRAAGHDDQGPQGARRAVQAAGRPSEREALEEVAPMALRPALSALPAYVPGRTVAGAIKLASNEVPYPPLPSVIDAIAAAAAGMNRYPDTFSAELSAALAAKFGVDVARVRVGCGSVSLCTQLVQAVADADDEVMYAWRSFEAYPIITAVSAASSVQVPLTDGFVHDLDAMAERITGKTRLVFVCNPNNPTGTTVDRDALVRFLRAVPADVVVAFGRGLPRVRPRRFGAGRADPAR